MPHDIFISYATEDKRTADAVCAAIEARGYRCWMAPRDVVPGMPYGEAIIKAIQGCRVMVLVFSSHANASAHIPKEVERAVSKGMMIVPFRIEDVAPAQSLDYFIGSVHWLDALTAPLDPHLQKLADAIAQTLPKGPPSAAPPVSSPDPAKTPEKKRAALWRGKAVMAVAAVVLLALLTGAGWLYRSRAAGGEAINSVAVLPFANGSGDPKMEYLSDGIAESLINSLSQLPNLKVMSRDSAFHYKGKDTDAETVGLELGVRAVFKGRVTQQGENLDVSAELIDARDNSHIWGEQYNRKATDIFALQSDIAMEITTALRTRLTAEDEKRVIKTYTTNPEAYQDYLLGRYWWNKRTAEGLNKAVEYFQQAIAKDPNYALAYSGLADSYGSLGGLNIVLPKESYLKAMEAAQKAVELDDSLAEAHTSLATIRTYDFDWSGAEKEFQRAIALDPNYASAHYYYSNLLSRAGRSDEAIAEAKRALELDPLSVNTNWQLALMFLAARQYDQAIEQCEKTLQMDPNSLRAHYYLGQAYVAKSMYKEGIAELEKGGGSPGYAYALSGRKAEAQKVLDQLIELSKQKYVDPQSIAAIYVGLGEKDQAIEWLEKGYEERSLQFEKVQQMWDPLRSDPRFQSILRRMNLTP